MLMTLKQHKLYVKEYPRDIEQPYQLYGLKVLRSAFSSLKGIAEDENYEYYYYDELKKIYLLIRKHIIWSIVFQLLINISKEISI